MTTDTGLTRRGRPLRYGPLEAHAERRYYAMFARLADDDVRAHLDVTDRLAEDHGIAWPAEDALADLLGELRRHVAYAIDVAIDDGIEGRPEARQHAKLIAAIRGRPAAEEAAR